MWSVRLMDFDKEVVYWEKDSFWSKMIPRFWAVEEYLMIWLLIRIEGIFVEVVGDLISSTVVLLVVRERELEASQPLSSSKQLFNIDMLVEGSGRLQYIWMSSAYVWKLMSGYLSNMSSRGAKYMLNRIGARTEPWGTPWEIMRGLVLYESMHTEYVRLSR